MFQLCCALNILVDNLYFYVSLWKDMAVVEVVFVTLYDYN